MNRSATISSNGLALAAALSLALAGCGRGGAPGAAPSGAPGRVVAHASALGTPSCTGTGAHDRHVSMFGCATCHPSGATYGFDQPYVFPGGTTTAGGTIVRTAGVAASCTVACHFPKGAPAHAVAWDAPAPLACTACHAPAALPAAHPPVAANAARSDCETCHLTSGHLSGSVAFASHSAAWMDPASPDFHALAANRGLAPCQACHGADLAGRPGVSSCASCHDRTLPQGVASWTLNCVMCHGGTDGPSGAPPKATWGNAADAVRVGAHTTHVAGTATSPAFGCEACHVRPADALAAGHLDAGPAEVVFGGVGAAWDRTAATCANVYCHGATLHGGSRTAPVWTRVGVGEAACGTCHGLPPPAPHPAAAGLGSCAGCHALTMDAAGALIPVSAGGKHVDGIVEATGGHAAGWLDTASPAFHAFAADRDLAGCRSCHGAALDGVGGSTSVGCADCHGATWKTDCTMCHGGTASTTGAPPRATWGNAGDPLRVGAHAVHLAGSAIAAPIACATCHLVPTDALSGGHADAARATVTFGGIAGAMNASPRYDAATGACASTYCHGGYSGTYSYVFFEMPETAAYAGSAAAPRFTDGPMTCTSCHGDPPAVGNWHQGHAGGTGCDLCHPDANAAGTVITDPAKHANGTIEVTPVWKGSCFNCH